MLDEMLLAGYTLGDHAHFTCLLFFVLLMRDVASLILLS